MFNVSVSNIWKLLFCPFLTFSLIADGNIYGLAVDWITGNVYGGGSGGDLFVCRPVKTGEMACETLLSDQGQINGIVLDPNSG